MVTRHLYLRGFPEELYDDLVIEMTPPSDWRELSRAEVDSNRLNKATTMKSGQLYSDFDIYTRVFQHSEDEAREIQALYLAGKKAEAAAAVPDALVDEIALCGPRERIRDRLAAWKAAGVTTLICATREPEAVRTMAELVL